MKYLISLIVLTTQCNRKIDSKYETDIDFKIRIDNLQNELNKSRNCIDAIEENEASI